MALTPEEFVTAFLAAETYDDLVEATGMSRETLMSRASRYRAKGVKLPRLSRRHGPLPMDVDALNAKVLEAMTP